MENKAHALAAGTFVLVVTALLIGLAVWLTRDSGQRVPYALSTRLSVAALQPQAVVRFRGLAVGKVETIGFDTTVPGNVLIGISVLADTPVTSSTFATLAYQGVTGLAYVQLDNSDESRTLLATSAQQPGRIPLRPGLFDVLIAQSTSLLAQTDQAAQRLNQLLSPANQKQLIDGISGLGQAATAVQQLASRADATLAQRLDPALAAVPALVAQANTTLLSLQKTTGEIDGTARSFSQLAQRINQSGGVLDQLAQSAETLSGTASTFNITTVPRFNRAADDTSRVARQFGRTAAVLTDNPQALIYGNVKPAPGPGEAGFAAPKP
jgi:phospholipid/cholesterol/gamma-HCH transport system substrate-binding protein